MSRLKDFAIWIILIIAFYIFTNVIIYLTLNDKKTEGNIYNEIKQNEIIQENNITE